MDWFVIDYHLKEVFIPSWPEKNLASLGHTVFWQGWYKE
jgi:hypothetical protein